jgi:prohibitin 1
LQKKSRIRSYDKKTNKAKSYHILLEDVSIYDLKFGTEFMNSIERKQVAQQEAERYKFVVAMAEEEKKAKIIEAEGSSIAAQMISEAVQTYGSAVIELKKIEAAKMITEKLTNSPNVSFVPSGNNLLLNLRK